MKIHENIEDLVEPSLAGALSTEEREAMERHLTDCEPCAAVLADAQEFGDFMRGSLEPMRPPEDLEDRIVRGLRSEGFAPRRWNGLGRIRVPIWARVAALIVVLVGVGAVSQEVLESKKRVPPGVMVDSRGQEEVNAPKYADTIVTDQESVHRKSGDVQTGRYMGWYAREGWGELGRGYVDASRHLTLDSRKVGSRDWYAKYGDEGSGKFTSRSTTKTFKERPFPKAPTYAERKVVKNGVLRFEVTSFEDAYKRVSEIVKKEHGFVASSSTEKLPNGKVRGQIVVRVPADKFDSIAQQFDKLGELKNQSITSQDVTKKYVDLASRLRGRQTLEKRLTKMIEDGKGELKDLLQVEKELGRVRGEIERIQGELKYYDNLIALSTMTLNLSETEIGRPFEYVQTTRAEVGISVRDADRAYKGAQDIVKKAGGRVLGADLSRSKSGSAAATIVAAVDAEKLPEVLNQLKALGKVSKSNIYRQKKPVGGSQNESDSSAPVRRERALVQLTIMTPVKIIRSTGELRVTVSKLGAAYRMALDVARKKGARILDGKTTDGSNKSTGILQIEIPEAGFADVVESFKALGDVKEVSIDRRDGPAKDVLHEEWGTLTLRLSTEESLVKEEDGFGATVRDSTSGAATGLLWSVEMLVVGTAYSAPWVLLVVLAWFFIRRARRKKKTAEA